METPILMIAFFALCGAGILLSLAAPRSQQGKVLAWLGCSASIALVLAGAQALLGGEIFSQTLWTLPGLTTLTLSCDRLSAVFVLITGLVLFPASIFAGGELARQPDHHSGRSFTVMLLGLYMSIVLIFIAGDAVLFLLAWEVMSILCWLLIVSGRNGEDGPGSVLKVRCGQTAAPMGQMQGRRPEAHSINMLRAEDAADGPLEPQDGPGAVLRQSLGAGYLLLALGEAGTLAVALGFILLGSGAKSLDFTALKSSAPALSMAARWAVFLLTFIGFGVKAGLVPVNFWLSRAYTAAPRAFVPVLAGATMNLGLYGILRVNADLLPAAHAGTGLVVLAVGTITALLGILYATTDNDLKTLLAHSSIENAGIIVAGFGAGMVFVSTDHPALAAIAFVAAVYQLVNHSLYKTLLFFGTGAVEAQSGTRDLDRLGGLIKWMPLTSLGFLAGVLSIAALPPFNGFVSEWLTLQAVLRSAELSSNAAKIVFALCGAGLALTAGLAVTCFVKVFAMTFLGMRRLDESRKVREPKAGVLAPMAILGVLCLAFGVLPTYVIPVLGRATSALSGGSASAALVPPFFASNPAHKTLPPAFVKNFHNIGAQVGQIVLPGRGLVVLHRGGTENPVVFAMSTSYMLLTLIVLLGLTWIVIRLGFTRRRRLARRERWDGGVRRLLPEMTYTATGFSNPVRVIFDAIFRPTTVEDTRETVAEHFRSAIRREKDRIHLMDKLVLRPVRSTALWVARTLARMHHGRLNAYITYAFLTLLVIWILFSLLAGL